jgi:protein-tyrosine phosphatase
LPTFHPKSRVIPLEGGLNFRDLGGYRGASGRLTRWRCLFRSGTTHLLTPTDLERVAELKIRAVMDLRSQSERQEHPHGLCREPKMMYSAHDYESVAGNLAKMLVDPAFDATQARTAMIDLYAEMPYEFAPVYRQLFLHASTGPLPLLFNCAAGKDRTGVAAALLLSAVGVDWGDIVADYLVTQTVVPHIIRILHSSKSSEALKGLSAQVLSPLVGVDRAYLDAMREAIIIRSGSIEDYLLSQLNLNLDVLGALRQRILD